MSDVNELVRIKLSEVVALDREIFPDRISHDALAAAGIEDEYMVSMTYSIHDVECEEGCDILILRVTGHTDGG